MLPEEELLEPEAEQDDPAASEELLLERPVPEVGDLGREVEDEDLVVVAGQAAADHPVGPELEVGRADFATAGQPAVAGHPAAAAAVGVVLDAPKQTRFR